MTVATEASYSQFVYTGAETTFPAGFAALSATDVFVSYFDADGLAVALTAGLHFSVAVDAAGAATVTRIAFPSASADLPVTIAIERITPALQGVDFDNLTAYDASVHERIADAGAMRDAELRNRQARAVAPFSSSETTVDFRPRTVRAADPVADEDLTTKAYVDLITGTDAAANAEAARDIALAAAAVVSAGATAVAGYVASAQASASMLGNPDYGFYTEAITSSRDYGTYF